MGRHTPTTEASHTGNARSMTRSSFRHLALVVGASVGIAGMVAPAISQQDTPESLFAALDNPHYGVRELALQRLLAQGAGLDLSAIEAMMGREDLSHEQRLRLEQVGLSRFRQMPRAGLGVQFDLNHVGSGAAIARAIEGFDSFRWLQPGDVILSIDGRPVTTANELRFEIISRSPGEAMPMVVDRGGEQVEVAPRLGSYAALGAAQPLSTTDLLWGWMLRMQRVGIVPAEVPVISVRANTENYWSGDVSPITRLTAGGTVRDTNSHRGVRAAQRLPEFNIEVRGGFVVEELDGRAMQIQLLNSRINQLESEIRLLQTQLPDQGAAEREIFELAIRVREQQLEQWKLRLKQLAEP